MPARQTISPRADLQRHIADGVVFVDLGGHGQVLDVQHGLARRARLLVHLEADLAAHHHGGQLLCRRVAGVDGADILALAEHGAPVGDGHDLRELVGDEEDGLALGRKVFHDLHQLVDLLRGEDGGRLVEDEDLVVAVEHLQDFRALLHADGNVLDEGVRVDAQAVFLAQREDLFPGLGPSAESPPCSARRRG